MLFTSQAFLVFFPIVVVLYFSTPARWRWTLLLGASYYFYASWRLEYLTLIIASTIVDYWAGLRMEKLASRQARKPYLLISLLFNLGLLFTFKYANFFGESLQEAFGQFNILADIPHLNLLLPVGISFYTFQTLSYSIDVYRGERPAERHLGIFALYVSFFPQLVAGPIERSTRLLPQFHQAHRFSEARLKSGLQLILLGYFKKLVIADRAASIVDVVYASPGAFGATETALATYLFAFQIYCDFSAYSDIAVGTARILGFDLMENFRRPYLAKSIPEFWRRWHISLSTWFRDYLYVPLGGNRVGILRLYLNLAIVFLVSGLWHGASWTFLTWGALHAVFIISALASKPLREGCWQRIVGRHGESGFLPSLVRPGLEFASHIASVIITFNLVAFSWIFFRAQSVGDAFILSGNLLSDWKAIRLRDLGNPYDLVVVVGAIGVLEMIHFFSRRRPIEEVLESGPLWARWGFAYGLVVMMIVFGQFTSQEFLYFQF